MEKKSYSELMQQSVEESRFYMEPANAVIDKNMVQLMRRTTPKFGWLFMQTIAIVNLESVLLNKLKSIENTIIRYR